MRCKRGGIFVVDGVLDSGVVMGNDGDGPCLFCISSTDDIGALLDASSDVRGGGSIPSLGKDEEDVVGGDGDGVTEDDFIGVTVFFKTGDVVVVIDFLRGTSGITVDVLFLVPRIGGSKGFMSLPRSFG